MKYNRISPCHLNYQSYQLRRLPQGLGIAKHLCHKLGLHVEVVESLASTVMKPELQRILGDETEEVEMLVTTSA
jgi:hypothetical protein